MDFPFLIFLLLSITGPNPIPVLAIPPAPPVHCNQTGCVLSSPYRFFNDRKECFVQTVLYPATEQEIRTAVAQASQNKLKVKVVSGFSHTIPKLACPDPTGSVLISTAEHNSNILVDVGKKTVTADSGVGLRDLIDEAEANGMSLVAAPYWEGVSVGGVISTGSIGSSWWAKGGALHDYVVGVRLVVPAGENEGFAKVLDINASDSSLFDAARVSLGLLGVISEVTFSLEPAFKRSITYSSQIDSLLQDEFADFGHQHQFADIAWYPSQYKTIYRLDDRVPLTTFGDGTNDYIGFQSTPILATIALRTSEKLFDETKNTAGKCATASIELASKMQVANGLKNNLVFTNYPVVGRQGKMQTSGSCQHSPQSDILSSCAWDPRFDGIFFFESTAIFPALKFRDFILDVKALRDLNPNSFCGMDVYTGFLIRYVKGSHAYLGQPEDSISVDFNYFRADDPLKPRLNQDVYEEVEQMAFIKYGARPHWAKNRKVAFFGVQRKYPYMSKFAAAKEALDPEGMFSSAWSDEMFLGEGGDADGDGCALDGECICSDDRHCRPSEGYLCRPGLVYQEARVCRLITS